MSSEKLKNKLEKEIIDLLKKEKKEKRKTMSNELGFRLFLYGILFGVKK